MARAMTDARTLTLALQGKWSGQTGIARCPAHDDRSPSLSIADGAEGRLLLTCHAGCAFESIRAALRQMGLLGAQGFQPIGPIIAAQRRAAAQAAELKRSHQAMQLWQDSAPVTGTPAERYLRSRGITCALHPSLRYKESCWHASARRLPALVASVLALQGNASAVHRTYLRPDGSGKAEVSPCKAMLGPVAGGAVRLARAPGPLVVAEGLETALSLLCGLLPGPAAVWAALSAGGMARLHLPPVPGQLIIAPDGDPTGRQGAEALALRAHALGWRVAVMPPPEGFDWNDVLIGKAGDPR